MDGRPELPGTETIRAMKRGDSVLYYHSVTGKAVVSIAGWVRGVSDPTAKGEDWSAVDLVPVRGSVPVPLDQLKADAGTRGMVLIRNSRLGVPGHSGEFAASSPWAGPELSRKIDSMERGGPPRVPLSFRIVIRPRPDEVPVGRDRKPVGMAIQQGGNLPPRMHVGVRYSVRPPPQAFHCRRARPCAPDPEYPSAPPGGPTRHR